MSGHAQEAYPHYPEADAFDIKKSIDAVRYAVLGHRWLIVLTTAMTLGVVLLYLALFPPTYQAEVVLMGTPKDDIHREEFYAHWTVFRKKPLADEAELMTSGIIVGRLVDELGLGFKDVYHTFKTHVGYLWTESTIGKSYRKIKHQLFPPQRSPYQLTPEEIDRGRAIHSFKDGIGIVPVPDTNIGALVVRAPTPQVADIANRLVDIYLEERKNRLMAEADTAYEALKREVDKAKQELDQRSRDLEQHYLEQNMLLAYEKDKVQVTNWLQLQTSIAETEAQLAALDQSLREVDRQLRTESKEVVTGRVLKSTPSHDRLSHQVIELKIALEQARLRFNESSPEVKDLLSQIAALESLKSQEKGVEESQSTALMSETFLTLKTRRSKILSEMEGVEAALRVRKANEEKLARSLRALPQNMRLTQEIERDRQILEKKYAILNDKLMVASVSRATIASAPPAIEVVDYAKYPEKPIAPKKKLLLLGGLVMGGLFGIFTALIWDFIDKRVNRYGLSPNFPKESIYAVISSQPNRLAILLSQSRV